jgi:hypothetical protein
VGAASSMTSAEAMTEATPDSAHVRRAEKGDLLPLVIGQKGSGVQWDFRPYDGPVTEPLVVMYSRKTCGLCDKARVVIIDERERASFRFEEVFIDGDEALEGDYGLRVPVVVVEGREEFEFEVDPARFSRLVRR